MNNENESDSRSIATVESIPVVNSTSVFINVLNGSTRNRSINDIEADPYILYSLFFPWVVVAVVEENANVFVL